MVDPASSDGYRPSPPAQADRIVWPPSFGTRFIVFVDTEEEFDWNAPLRRTGYGVSAIDALPAAHRRFAERDVPLTLLVDYPIATDPRAIACVQEVLADHRCTVGAHLHPWVNPPFDEMVSAYNSYAGNLPQEIEAAKLDVLTDAIESAFAIRPRSYRAGRYGIGPATLGLLASRGYVVDSSMRSRYCYAADGGADFGAIDNNAFCTGLGGAVIELPLTTAHIGLFRRGGEGLYRGLQRVPRGRGIFSRLGLLSRIALTPEDMPVEAALEAIAVVLGEGLRLLSFAFHSPSLKPGHTPYVRDAEDLARFHHWWDRILEDLQRRGVAAASLDEVIAAAGLPAAPGGR